MENSTVEGMADQKSLKVIPPFLFLLLLFSLFCIAVVLVIGLAMGFAFCLSALVPAIEFGTATVIALLAQMMVLFAVVNVIGTLPGLRIGSGASDQFDDSNSNLFVDAFAEQVANEVVAKTELYEPLRRTPPTKRGRQKMTQSK